MNTTKKTFYIGEYVWVYDLGSAQEAEIISERLITDELTVYGVRFINPDRERFATIVDKKTFSARQLYSRPSERDALVEQIREDAKDLNWLATDLEEAASAEPSAADRQQERDEHVAREEREMELAA